MGKQATYEVNEDGTGRRVRGTVEDLARELGGDVRELCELPERLGQIVNMYDGNMYVGQIKRLT